MIKLYIIWKIYYLLDKTYLLYCKVFGWDKVKKEKSLSLLHTVVMYKNNYKKIKEGWGLTDKEIDSYTNCRNKYKIKQPTSSPAW